MYIKFTQITPEYKYETDIAEDNINAILTKYLASKIIWEDSEGEVKNTEITINYDGEDDFDLQSELSPIDIYMIIADFISSRGIRLLQNFQIYPGIYEDSTASCVLLKHRPGFLTPVHAFSHLLETVAKIAYLETDYEHSAFIKDKECRECKKAKKKEYNFCPNCGLKVVNKTKWTVEEDAYDLAGKFVEATLDIKHSESQEFHETMVENGWDYYASPNSEGPWVVIQDFAHLFEREDWFDLDYLKRFAGLEIKK